jgi:uncharacterized protein YdhG (YjbR/CyaY superfamily)
MSASIYTDKLLKPDDMMLTYDLAQTKSYLDKIIGFIESEYGNFKPEWKFYNKKSGWILKMFTKKRNVLFVVPSDKHFRVAFTFSEKASDLIYSSELPEYIKNELSSATQYAEGRTIQIEVKSETDFENILKMIRIKLMN